jgi:hypothetical protein
VSDALERARPLRLMAFDVDGVLTDGVLYFNDEGAELKAFHTLDGLGLKLLRDAGVELALISGRRSSAVAARAANLGITRLFQGVEDKLAVFERVRGELRLDAHACGSWATICRTCPSSRAADSRRPFPRRPMRCAPAYTTSAGPPADAARRAKCAT